MKKCLETLAKRTPQVVTLETAENETLVFFPQIRGEKAHITKQFTPWLCRDNGSVMHFFPFLDQWHIYFQLKNGS